MGRPARSQRIWFAGVLGLLGGVVFTAGWLVAGFTQGSRYSVSRDDISDMGAIGAPHAWILLVSQGISGACILLFGFVGLRSALAGAKRPTLLASLAAVPLGLGNLSDAFFRIDCRAADGCSPSQAVHSWHAVIHSASSILLLVAVIAPFVVTRALRRLPAWSDLARPSFVLSATILLSIIAGIGLGRNAGAGYAQRAFALIEAVWIGLLARRVIQLAVSPGTAPLPAHRNPQPS